MRKIFVLLICVLFTSCWIEPKIGEWEQDGKYYYFEDFDTMNNIIRPEINKTFPSWHWNEETFKMKYEEFLNNIKAPDEIKAMFQDKNYSYIVKVDTSKDEVECINAYNKTYTIKGKYYLIVKNNYDAVVFFEN